MTDSLLQTLILGVVGALFAFELVVAMTSLLEVRDAARPGHHVPLVFTRSFAIREHMSARQGQINTLRCRYPSLRSPGYAHQIRNAIRRLQPTPPTAFDAGCASCRGSRMRGFQRCPTCGRRLVAPAQGPLA